METIVNYYDVLGVSTSATSNEIKQAYRKKAKQCHPDKANGNAELFKKIKQAYEVLKNPEKRKAYNQLLFKPEPKQEAPASASPRAAVINIGRKTRKGVSLSSLVLNAAFILVGVLGNAYLNRRR